MKRFFQTSVIAMFMLAVLLACPVYSETGSNQQASDSRQTELDGSQAASFSLLQFYRHQVGLFHTRVQNLLTKTGLDESLLNRMFITAERQNSHLPSSLPEQTALLKIPGNTFVKTSGFHDPAKPNTYPSMYEFMRSQILAPYKDKTTAHNLMSVMVPIAATNHITIIPVVSGVISINGIEQNDIKDRSLLTVRENALLYGGINLSYSF